MTINSPFYNSGKTFVIAEMSANHGHDFDMAVRVIEAAKESGADAIKLQTYTADTLTIDCDNEYFRIEGTPWDGRTLHALYEEAHTPWEWQPHLKMIADKLDIALFSTPFDSTAVDFLEELNVPIHKIASFENVDLPLIRKVASTGKPVIMSTGMASEVELEESVATFREAGGAHLTLLKCTSAYPAPPEEMNLLMIPYLRKKFDLPVGLSDHTLGSDSALAAVALGAPVIEKHFCLDRSIPGPDSAFSMEPTEFRAMVDSIRRVEKALGTVCFELTEKQQASVAFRRSLFVVENIREGERFTPRNVRSIRPGHGLHTRHLDDFIGKRARQDIDKGTPLSYDYIQGNTD